MSILFRVLVVSAMGAFIGYLTAGGDPRALGISDAYASQGEALAKEAGASFLEMRSKIKLAIKSADTTLTHTKGQAAPSTTGTTNKK